MHSWFAKTVCDGGLVRSLFKGKHPCMARVRRRRNRIQLVEEGSCRVTGNKEIKGFPQQAAKISLPDDGGGD